MFFNKKLIRGGVHPQTQKQLSSNQAIYQLPYSKNLYLSLKQHSGAPANPIVQVGEQVTAGQLLATGQGGSANIHAPQSGVINAIADFNAAIPGQGKQTMIHLVCNNPTLQSRLKINHTFQTRAELIDIIADAGIVGMGGAVFPTATKLRSTLTKNIHTLLINGCECEPYLTCDDLIMQERCVQLVGGIRYLLTASGAPKALIGIEDNKPEALQHLLSATSEDDNIDIKVLPTHYPMGSAKQFIYALCQVEVPKGKRSTEVGVFVQNVATCVAIYNAIRFGHAMTHRVITISGGGIETPMNIEAPIGTLISELVAACGGLKPTTARTIVGGPMMGHTITNLHTPISKGTSGVLFLNEQELPQQNTSPCISCGQCVAACPMGLLPNAMAELIANDDLDSALKRGLNTCLLCGSCAFICPASLPLTQYFSYATAQLARQRKMESKAQLSRRLNEQRTLRLAQEAQRKAQEKAAKKAAKAKRAKQKANAVTQEI